MADKAAPDSASFSRFCAGESTDAHRLFGCHRADGDRRRFTVWAPNAGSVSLLGDFNGWQAEPMERLPSGAWTAERAGVHIGDIYKYKITGSDGAVQLKSDPYALHYETPPANGSRVWDLGGFDWGDGDWMATRQGRDVRNAPMSIYELHLGSWRTPAEGARCPSYRETAAALAAYCTDMGYTHVELLPITEHPLAESWGYQATGYFAPTSRHGTPQDFMAFVDTLHRAGLGVILDWVPAHFPRDAFALARFDGTSLYERDDPEMATHPDWGTLIFDYAKGPVRSFLRSSAALWLEDYHIDGLRFDAVSSMLHLGFGRGEDFKKAHPGDGIDRDAVSLLRTLTADAEARGAFTVAEESSAYPGVTAPDGLGFTFQWDMGFMHDTLDYMALDPLWRSGSHEKLTFSMLYAFSERFILAYSHDEVVHGKRSMLDKMSGDYDGKFASLRTLYGFQFAHPGKKLGFMGGEFGQFIEWDKAKALDWFLLDYPRHVEMQRWYRALNRFYAAHPALWERDTDWSGFDWLNVDDAGRNAVAFQRIAAGERVICLCNFSAAVQELQVALPGPGTLTLLLDSDEYRFGGTGAGRTAVLRAQPLPFLDHSHSALLTAPPLSCAYYDFALETF